MSYIPYSSFIKKKKAKQQKIFFFTTKDFYREHPYTHHQDSTMNMLLYTYLLFIYSSVLLVTFQNKWQTSLQYPLDIIRI